MPQISDLHAILHAYNSTIRKLLQLTQLPLKGIMELYLSECICACVVLLYIYFSVCEKDYGSASDGVTSHVRREWWIALGWWHLTMCVNKRHVGNYPGMQGQREGGLFASAWTPVHSKGWEWTFFATENIDFSPIVFLCLWTCLCHPTSHPPTLTLWAHFIHSSSSLKVNRQPDMHST